MKSRPPHRMTSRRVAGSPAGRRRSAGSKEKLTTPVAILNISLKLSGKALDITLVSFTVRASFQGLAHKRGMAQPAALGLWELIPGQDNGHVVFTAARQGSIHQRLTRLICLLVLGENGFDVIIGDHLR